MATRRKKLTHFLLRRVLLEGTYKINGSLPVFPRPPTLCSIKEPDVQTRLDDYFGTLVCHLLSQPAFQIVIFFASTPNISDLLACGEESKMNVDLVVNFIN